MNVECPMGGSRRRCPGRVRPSNGRPDPNGKVVPCLFPEEFADHGRPFGGATFGGCVVTAGTPSRRRGIPSDVLGIHDPVGIPLLGQEPLAFRSEVLIERVPGHQ